MEFLEAKALKSSFHWELAMESAREEEILCFNGATLVAGEEFQVDEFLNFSNGDFEHGSDMDDEFDQNRHSVSASSNLNQSGEFPVTGEDDSKSLLAVELDFPDTKSGEFPVTEEEDFKSLLAVELDFPGDALPDLEWVSQFVDDSCSEFTAAAVALNRSEPEKNLVGTVISCLPAFFPVRPRTKRSRLSRQTPTSSSSSSATSSGDSSAMPLFIFSDAGENVDSVHTSGKPPKKQRKRSPSSLSPAASQFPRRCSHCLVQKTPQWRSGPHGAKTLCNACGVRFKSGRLFPEYRPALSPTFCSGVHSNSHRKVVEMRKLKDGPEPATALTPMVPSY